jgi:hypothetical protein
MGIYSNGSIFGIRFYVMNDDDRSITLFEKTYPAEMSYEQKNEAYAFYSGLNNTDELRFAIYTQCCSTHDLHNTVTYMMWQQMSLSIFLEKFRYRIATSFAGLTGYAENVYAYK